MTREEAKVLMPIIQAFAEGKDIEMRSKNPHIQLNGWTKMDEFIFGYFEYRIKPEPKYRPFKDAEECQQEMQKHYPIGYTKLIGGIEYSFITDVDNTINYSDAIKEYTFADGTPFGIKEEE